MKVEVIAVNYKNTEHGRVIVQLMDHYASDVAGGGAALSDFARTNLVNALAKVPGAFSLLGLIEGEPAALVNCFMGFSTFNCKPLVNIHDFVVVDKFRGNGVARRMLDAVQAKAKELNCCKLTLEVLSGNDSAKKAYQKYGFSAYELSDTTGTALFWEKKIVY